MRNKRGISLFLALLLSLSLSVTAMAAEIPESQLPLTGQQAPSSGEETDSSQDEVTEQPEEEEPEQPEENDPEQKTPADDIEVPEVLGGGDNATEETPSREQDGRLSVSNEWTVQDFTYGEISHTLTGCDYQREIKIKGMGITGFSESGKVKIQKNKNLVIPARMADGTTIVGIGSNAFKGQGLESLTLPDRMMIPYDDKLTGVIHERGNFMIKDGAFANNNLTSMNFPEGILYIDVSAFQSNKLSSVTFPHTLWMIGNSAFNKNQLTSVNFSKTNDFLFQMDAFAFSNNKLKSVTLPYFCEKVDMKTFYFNPGMEVVPDEAPDKEKTFGGVVHMYSSNPDAKNRDRIHHIERTAESQKSWHQRLIIGSQPAEEPVWKSGDFTYSGTVITGLTDSGKARRVNDRDLVLPDKNPGGAYITEIAAGTPDSCGTFSSAEEIFDSVKLPAQIQKIGNYAFAKNQLSAVSFPDTLTEIGMMAFGQNSITSVALPDSVAVLGQGAFSGQKEKMLTSVTLSKGLKLIPASAFAQNAIKELTVPEGITSIGRMAFQSSPLNTLTLPSTLETIESNAFNGHELTELTIPGKVKAVTSSAFAQNGSAAGGTGSLKTLVLKEGIETIAANAFRYAGLTTVSLPDSLKKLDKNAFNGGLSGVVSLITDNYTHLTDKSNFPDSASHQIKLNTENWKAEDFTYDGSSVTGLSDSGLLKRKENRKLVLPDQNVEGADIRTIAGGGTYGTFGAEGEVFESVTLPARVQVIGDKAFLSNKLTEVSFPETVTQIGLQAFALNDLTDIKLPDSLTTLGQAAFSNNVHVKTIQLGKNLAGIPASAFGIVGRDDVNANLERVVIPEGVTGIGSRAFVGHEIQMLVLPTSLTKIDSLAFSGNQLETLILPSDVTDIGSGAFAQPKGKSRLHSVKLYEGLMKIDSKAFSNAALTRVDIPFSLTTLNKLAFEGNQAGIVQVYTPNDDHIKFEVSGATFAIHIRSDIWTVNDFEYDGTAVTGLSEKGIRKRAENHSLVLPDRNKDGNYITEIAAPKSGDYGTFSEEANQFESVVFPAKLEKIGNKAFQNNKLSQVIFPESLKEIGMAAFQVNQLMEVILPDSVTTLGGGAFATNQTLQKVTLSKNLKEIPAGAFGCSGTEYMEGFTSVVIPEGVTAIGDNAFAGNNFTEIRIPSTVKTIGRLAFSTKKSLTAKTALLLPDGLMTIKSFAFRNQNIESVDLPYTVSAVPDNAFQKDYPEGAVTKVRVEIKKQYTDKTSFPDSQYHQYVINADHYTKRDFTYDTTKITGLSEDGKMKRPLNKNLVLPDRNPEGEDITEISAGKAGEYGTFGEKDEVYESVMLPGKLVKIGNYAFRANRLETVGFPDTLNEIGLQAFAENVLTEVILPDRVTILGGGAFTSNPTLKKAVLSKGLKTVTGSAFLNNTAAAEFTSVVIPEGITSIGDDAFGGNSFTEIMLPSTVTKIGKRSFAQTDTNRSITKVTLPSGLTEIGAKAFKDSLLSRMDIPKGLQKLAKDTFFNTAGRVVSVHTSNKAHLEETKNFFPSSDYHQAVYDQMIESGWTEEDFTYHGSAITGWSAKGNETRLKNHQLVLPTVNPESGEDLTVIGKEAFKIPDNEWEQGKTGIDSPNGMESVLLPERLQKIESKAFQYNNLKTVNFPETVKTIGESAFNSNKIEELTLPDTITELDSGAFSTNIMNKLVLSKGLTKIPQAAFSMNIELSFVELPDTITDIGDFAFAGARIETLEIPASVKRIGKKAFHLHHLTELVVPGTVKEIGDSAFEGTFKAITLKKVTLEEGIEKIGPLAFKEGYLETVELPSTLISLASDAFFHNSGTDHDYIVKCYTKNPAHLKFQNSASHKIMLRKTVWDIEDFVFGSSLSRATFQTDPETTITGFSESGLEKLKTSTDITLPQRNSKGEIITAIGDLAFANLPVKLTSVTFAEGLLHIGNGAFKGNALQELLFPATLKTIGNEALALNRLTELTLPENVESIGSSAFDGNTDVDGNVVKVKVYITNEEQGKIPGSEGFEIIGKTPETPGTPEIPFIPGSKESGDVPGQTLQVNQVMKKAAKTSDRQIPAGYLLAMFASLAMMLYLVKRKTEGKED